MPTLSIVLTNAQALRVSKMVGRRGGLGHDASLAESEQYLIRLLRNEVADDERAEGIKGVDEGITPLAVSNELK